MAVKISGWGRLCWGREVHRGNPPPPRAQSLMFSILVDKSGKYANNHENPFAISVKILVITAFCHQVGTVLEPEIHSNRRKCGQGALWNGLMRHGACSRRWSPTLPKPRWKFGVTFGPRPTPEIEPTSTFQQKNHPQCMISSVYL